MLGANMMYCDLFFFNEFTNKVMFGFYVFDWV